MLCHAATVRASLDVEGTNMNRKSYLVLAVTLVVGISIGAMAKGAAKEIVLTPAADVKWTPMDEKAGDKGPQMSVVFGDLKKKGPVGVMMHFPAGAQPGPHTHTSDYWAVVIKGVEHDFAPGQAEGAKDLAAGSWWMQPGNMPHDNLCAKDAACDIFVYMPNGFDMKPVKVADAK
jgi:hypothetical protein